MLKTSEGVGYVALLYEIIKRTILTYSSINTLNRYVICNGCLDKKKVTKKYMLFLKSFCVLKNNKWAQLMLDETDSVDMYKLLRISKNMAYDRIYELTGFKKYKINYKKKAEVKKLVHGLIYGVGGGDTSSGMLKETNLLKSVLL